MATVVFRRAAGVACVVGLVLFGGAPSSAQQNTIKADGVAAPGFRPTIGLTGGGRTRIDIVTPKGGVSHNKYETFSISPSGVVINNSPTRSTDSKGGTVPGNANISTSGPAAVILNEVTGSGKSLLEGAAEVVGSKADVIIANPNGVTCNGCSFLNTGRGLLTTGVPSLNSSGDLVVKTDAAGGGARVEMKVLGGQVEVGAGGVSADGDLILSGRHTIIDGSVSAPNGTATVSGGGQIVDSAGNVRAATATQARQSIYAVDAAKVGAMTAGAIRIIGTEAGLGVNVGQSLVANGMVNKVQITAPASKVGLELRSAGNLTTNTITVRGPTGAEPLNGFISASEKFQPTGKVMFSGDLTVTAGEVFVPKTGTLYSTGNLTVNADTAVIIDGEVSGVTVSINTANGYFKNTGFIFSRDTLSVQAGESVENTRNTLDVYEAAYDSDALKYIAQWKKTIDDNPTSSAAASARRALANAENVIFADQYVQEGGSFSGRNIAVSGGIITNKGGAFVAANDLVLQTTVADLTNTYLVLRHKIDAEDGCVSASCGEKLSFHAGELLAGNDIVLNSKYMVNNFASNIIAYNNISISAARTFRNFLASDRYVLYSRGGSYERGGDECIDDSCGGYRPSIRITSYAVDDQFVLSAANVASYRGNISVNSHYFENIGSKITAAQALTVRTKSSLHLTQVAVVERDYKGTVTETEHMSDCGGDGGCSPVYATSVAVAKDEIVRAIAGADLIANEIDVVAGSIRSLGARAFAKSKLKIATSGGALVADSSRDFDGAAGSLIAKLDDPGTWDDIGKAHLPDDSALSELNFLELTSAPHAFLTANAARRAGYVDWAGQQDAFRAVAHLRTSPGVVTVQTLIRSVGVQSFRATADAYSGTTAMFDDGVVFGRASVIDALANHAPAAGATMVDEASVNALAWRYALSTGYDDINRSRQTIFYSDGDAQISAAGDAYIIGGSQFLANGDLTVASAKNVILFAVRNTGLGRETGVTVETVLADLADGAARIYETDPATGVTKVVDTSWYDIVPTSLIAGKDLMVSAGVDFRSYGGSLVALDNVFVTTTTGKIQQNALQENFILTKEMGCKNDACGRTGFHFFESEITSGGGVILAAKTNVENYSSSIAGAGSVAIDAGADVIIESLKGKFLIDKVDKSSFFGLNKKKKRIYRGVIEVAGVNSQFGDVEITAGNDVRILGAEITGGGDVALSAKRDLTLDAVSIELENMVQQRGFSGFGYRSNKTYFNDFETALTAIVGQNIALSAGQDIRGFGARLSAADDLVMSAERDVNFDADQNEKYIKSKGFSFGIGVKGTDFIEAALNGGDGDALLENYLSSNPALAATHTLATAKGKWGTINGLLALGYHAPSILPGVQTSISEPGQITTGDLSSKLTDRLNEVFNPFNGLSYSNIAKGCAEGGFDPVKCAMAVGLTFRFQVWSSEQRWTVSHVSRLVAGRDLSGSAGRDLSLIGGTHASAAGSLILAAEQDLLVSALADTSSSRSTSWGVSLGFAPDGITFGVNGSAAQSSSRTYTNASITAADELTLVAGRDVRLVGANVAAGVPLREHVAQGMATFIEAAAARDIRVYWLDNRKDDDLGSLTQTAFREVSLDGPATASTAVKTMVAKIVALEAAKDASVTATTYLVSRVAGRDDATLSALFLESLESSRLRERVRGAYTDAELAGRVRDVLTAASQAAAYQWLHERSDAYIVPRFRTAMAGTGLEAQVAAAGSASLAEAIRSTLKLAPTSGTAHILDGGAQTSLSRLAGQSTETVSAPIVAALKAANPGWDGIGAMGTIAIDAGRDLVVASRQNTATSESKAFNFSVTVDPSGTPTGFSLGGSMAEANRRYTDTPTTVEAEAGVDVRVGRTTYLAGAMLNARSGRLKLDTGNFVFDHFGDVDVAKRISAQVTVSADRPPDARGSIYYKKIEAKTFATVGAGEIVIRNSPSQSLIALNRDAGNMQKIISKELIDLEIPGVNLAQLSRNIQASADVIRGFTANIPDEVRAQGDGAVSIYRNAIAAGKSPEQLREMVSNGKFSELTRLRSTFDEMAVQHGGAENVPAAVMLMIARGEISAFNSATDTYTIRTNCGDQGPLPCEILKTKRQLITEIDAKQLTSFIFSSIEAMRKATAAGSADSMLEAEKLRLAYACAAAWTAENEQGLPMEKRLLEQVMAAHGPGEAGIAKTYLSLIAAGIDPVKVVAREEVFKATAAKDVAALRALSSRLTAIYNARAFEGYTVSQTDLRDMGRVIQTLANDVSTGVPITSTMAALKNYYDDGAMQATREEATARSISLLKSLGEIAAGEAPYLSVVLAAADFKAAMERGDTMGVVLAVVSAAPGVPRADVVKKLTIRDHYVHHNAMVSDVVAQLKAQGFSVQERRSFAAVGCVGYCVPDIFYKSPGGRVGIIEVKTGDAELSIRQSSIFPQISSGMAAPRGSLAAEFGLRPGVSLKDQGYPRGIDVTTMRFPGAQK